MQPEILHMVMECYIGKDKKDSLVIGSAKDIHFSLPSTIQNSNVRVIGS